MDRNFLKRICRESFRLAKSKLAACDFLVIFHETALNYSSKEMAKMLQEAWRQVASAQGEKTKGPK